MLAEPPPPAIVAPADDETAIEVVGTRSDQVQKIDRRTYRVKDNAHAAQSDTLQLLRGLPAIIVTPDDQLLMLGNSNVTVLVDDRPIQGDVTQYLRTLHGSDVERIEIITNPSAQYAASGSGGIINIVLRRKRADGITGSASLLASSQRRIEGGATLKLKRGKWGFEVEAQATAGRFARSTSRQVRTIEQPGGITSVNRATGDSITSVSRAFLRANATYDVSARTNLSLTVAGGPNQFRSVRETHYLGIANFASFDEIQRRRDRSNFRFVQLDYDHKGKADGETLKAGTFIYAFRASPLVVARYDNGGGYIIDSPSDQSGVDSKVDWVHPIGKSRILSLGAEFDRDVSGLDLQATTLGPGGLLDFATSDAFRTRDVTSAVYATYQLKFGKLTLLPGLRVERFDRTITSPGQPSLAIRRTGLFPSFHLDRPFGDEITLSLSYSRRVDRTSASQLRPYLTRRSAIGFERGNPDLRDQTTDSFEMNLHYHHKKLDLGAIIYDRETANLFDNSLVIDAAGNSISTPINAGRKTNRGAEIDLSLPLLRRVKGTASVNLFNSIVPYDTGSGTARFSQFRHSANATLNWQGKDGPKRPGDIGQLQLEYDSASRTFQYRNSASFSANLSFTHNLSKTLALTASLNGIGSGHSRTRLLAPSIQSRYDLRTRQPEFKLKLVKTLGRKK